MDHHRAIRILALGGVVRDRSGDPDAPPSVDYQRRKIWMWYSETFSTPLHLVDRLPVEDIMAAYYQYHYQQMSEEDLQEEIRELTGRGADAGNLDKAETLEVEAEIEEEDTLEEAWRRAKEKARAKAAGAPPPPVPGPVVKREKASATKPLQPRGAETDLPDAVADVGDKLKMTFMTLEDLERLENSDGLGQVFEPLTGLDDEKD